MPDSDQKAKGRTIYILGITALVVCLMALALLALFRHRSIAKEQQSRQAAISAGARVQVAYARPAASERKITVTGEARPYVTVTLYAKVSGYLKEIPVDKGDPVNEGDLLARLESPELDSQYRAALVDARNKKRFADRELALLKDGIISQQEAEDAVSAAKSAAETAASLRTQKGYQVIKAPFKGVVTARFADPGALLQSAATGQNGALPVVTVSRTDRLRIYLYLDQKSASQVQVRDRALVSDPSRPDRKLPARVARISGQLDPNTRTMLCELDVDNSQQQLLAGGFVDVILTVSAPPFVEVPAAAVYTREEKTMVAVIANDNRVRYRPVLVADSDGKQIRLAEGVQTGERVALNPGTGLTEGELVQPVEQKGQQAEQKGGAGGK